MGKPVSSRGNCAASEITRSAAPERTTKSMRLGFAIGILLCRIDKLPNLCPLLVEFRETLLAEALINIELLLGKIFFTRSDEGLGQPVMHVGQI